MLDFPAQAVYLKQRWQSDWIAAPTLYCTRASFASIPDMSRAELYYNYGDVLAAGAFNFARRSPDELRDYYVKIEFLDPSVPEAAGGKRVWVGLIVEATGEIWGDRQNSVPTGRQHFVALGLEVLLDRFTIRESVLATQLSENSYADYAIGRALAFNGGADTGRESGTTGNKRSTLSVFYLPGPGEPAAAEWRLQSAVRYLLDLFNYSSGLEDALFSVTFEGTIGDILIPPTKTEGRTVWDLLCQLIDRRRMAMGFVTFSPSYSKVRLEVTTTSDIDLPLADDQTLTANESRQAWDGSENCRLDASIQSARVAHSSAASFERVIARGERRTATLSLVGRDEAADVPLAGVEIEPDWSEENETEFETGATAQDGYGDLPPVAKAQQNGLVRRQEKLRRVYQYFRVPGTWNGRTIADVEVCPKVGHGETGGEPLWNPGLRLESGLPLRDDLPITAFAEFESPPGYGTDRPPLVLAKIQDKWQAAEHIQGYAELDDNTKIAGGWEWSISAQMQDDRFGVILKPVGGGGAQTIAREDFTPVDAEDWPAVLDWRTELIATVCLACDAAALARYPSGPLPPSSSGSDLYRELVINVPGARLDYLVPGTYLAAQADGTLLTAAGGFVVDDRSRLANVARLAYLWYGRPHRALVVTTRIGAMGFSLGDLITNFGRGDDVRAINAPITALEFDLLAGQVTVQTNFSEIDAVHLAR